MLVDEKRCWVLQQVKETYRSREGECGECILPDPQCQKYAFETSGLIDHRTCKSVVSLTDRIMSIQGNFHGYHGRIEQHHKHFDGNI